MEKLEGVVRDIIFESEENSFTIFKIEDENESHIALGTFPFLSIGQTYILEGDWVVHEKFGKQFRCENYEEIIPNTEKGIERYLSSGVVSGIGPVTAKKLVDKFGVEVFDIIEKSPERLREINGIGKKKVEIIIESYNKGREVKNIMIFLQGYGVTPKQALKIYKVFGNDSIAKVKENPYVLSEEVRNIGFKTADKIAMNLGIEKDSPFRIQSGIKHVINEFCSQGSTYIPKGLLITKVIDVLEVGREIVEDNLLHSVMTNKLVIENIDGVEGVFTLPFLYSEVSITKHMVTKLFEKIDNIDIDIGEHILEFEKLNNIKFHKTQKEAIKGAVTNGVLIITGGPGTGKTTIIKCILSLFEKSNQVVVMGAPTGRAAKRMTESTGREATTIHRMLDLGISDDDIDIYLDDEEKGLTADVVIIDEASMLDVMLMDNLLRSIKPKARLILVGDADQLPSVGSGRVLEDLIKSEAFKVVSLSYIYRQGKESYITENAHRINTGEMPYLNMKESDFFFINGNDALDSLNKTIELVNERLPKYNEAWDKTKDFQILTPMRRGDLGVYNLNMILQKVLNKNTKTYDFTEFKVGDKVMQTKNNYMIKWTKIDGTAGKDSKGEGIFNGDIGYVTKIDDEEETVEIVFDEDKLVKFESSDLDELELAYAITIHKSQGSEFKVVIIPVFMGPPLLMSRNLIYTAVTRAKELLVLVGSKRALSYMISNTRTFERYTSLKFRIQNIINENIIMEGD
ncbi:MAG: ATP-dependent RecD-like DNA helicase [Clostridium sp.]|nr:ATP-dependent RecD-like DNA helicase [Clostridium sp.]